MLFDWLVTATSSQQTRPDSVRGPRHAVNKGSTPALSSEQATALLASVDVSTPVGLRERALIAAMTYTFARVSAAVALSVEDYFPQKKRWWLRLREKNGKVNEMPCHHKLELFLDAYLDGAGLRGDHKGPLFRSAIGKTGQLSEKPLGRGDVWRMVRRRAKDAGIETEIGCHTFRATGITDYLTNGGRIEVAAAHGRPLQRQDHGPLRPAQRRHQHQRDRACGYRGSYAEPGLAYAYRRRYSDGREEVR